jgi:peptidoglycan/LPS O-acetylase OafA/YrhL
VLTALAIGFYSVIALVVANVAQSTPRLALAGFAACAAALPVTAALIWSDGESEPLWRWTAVCLIVAVSAAQAAALISRRRPKESGETIWVLRATLALIAVVAAMAAGPLALAVEEDLGDAYARALGVLLVLDVLGTVLLPILRKLGAASRPDART